MTFGSTTLTVDAENTQFIQTDPLVITDTLPGNISGVCPECGSPTPQV